MKSDSAVVYLVKCGRFVKIGHTSDIEDRVAAFRTGNPYPLMVARLYGPWSSNWAYNVEVRAHLALRDHAHSGEWFACSVRTADRAIRSVVKRLYGQPEGAIISPRSRSARFLATYGISS